MERRALIALALSFVVFLAFIYFGEKSKIRRSRRPSGPASPAQPPRPRRRPRLRPSPWRAPTAAQPAAAPGPAGQGRRGGDPAVSRRCSPKPAARLKSFQLKKYLESLPFKPISNFKLGPVAFELERYHSPAASPEPNPRSWCVPGTGQELPLALAWEGKGLEVPGTLFCEASRPGLNLKAGEKGTLKFTCTSPKA